MSRFRLTDRLLADLQRRGHGASSIRNITAAIRAGLDEELARRGFRLLEDQWTVRLECDTLTRGPWRVPLDPDNVTEPYILAAADEMYRTIVSAATRG